MHTCRHGAGDGNDHGTAGTNEECAFRNHGELAGAKDDDNTQRSEHQRRSSFNDVADSSGGHKGTDKEIIDGIPGLIADRKYDQGNQTHGNRDNQGHLHHIHHQMDALIAVKLHELPP